MLAADVERWLEECVPLTRFASRLTVLNAFNQPCWQRNIRKYLGGLVGNADGRRQAFFGRFGPYFSGEEEPFRLPGETI
jgi:hypothetical protein